MATFDISPVIGGTCGSRFPASILTGEDTVTARNAPDPGPRYVTDSTRMRDRKKPSSTHLRGVGSPCLYGMCTLLGLFFGPLSTSWADPVSSSPTTRTRADIPPRSGPPTLAPGGLPPSWDLDGFYVWLGPVAAIGRIDNQWDTSFGAHLALVRVRERERLGALGIAAQGAVWSERGGGRIAVDAVVGTRIGRMIGASLGGVLELHDERHPRWGGTVGVWTFVGVTPFVRAGIVQDLGAFGEVGLAVAFPAWRSRH
jgi:hypothetical protein